MARLFCPWSSPGNYTGIGSHSLLQGIFLIQGSNLGFPHCRQILYYLSHQRSPLNALLLNEWIWHLNPYHLNVVALVRTAEEGYPCHGGLQKLFENLKAWKSHLVRTEPETQKLFIMTLFLLPVWWAEKAELHICVTTKDAKRPESWECVVSCVNCTQRSYRLLMNLFFCKPINFYFNWHMLTLPTPAQKYFPHLNTLVPIHEQIWAHADSTILPCLVGKCVHNTIITTAIWTELDGIRALIGLLK